MVSRGVDGIEVAAVRHDLSSDVVLTTEWMAGESAHILAAPPPHTHRRTRTYGTQAACFARAAADLPLGA